MRPSASALVLTAILIGATALRVAGIGHHLLHDAMDFDEMNNFVEPMMKMLRTGSPDPTVYSGYPGFFNWLAFLPTALGKRVAGSYGAFLGARLVVAAFGVVNVLLVYLLCRRWTGAAGPALLAAGLMAVSHGHVRATHNITPDVVVASGVLAVLLVLESEGSPRAWALAGALCGLATAVKYTGLLAAPALVVGLALRPGWRRSLPIAAASALGAFALAAPYAVGASGSMGMGFDHSMAHYYGADAEANRALQGKGLDIERVVGYFLVDLSCPALLLALAAPALWRRRSLAPAFAVIVAAIAVMAPANKVYPRHVLPATAAAIALAGAACAGLRKRVGSPVWQAAVVPAVGILVLGAPTVDAVRMAATYRGPTPADAAVRWVEGRLAAGALIASSVEPFVPDPERFEVRGFDRLSDLPVEARGQYDLVVFKGLAPRRLPDVEITREFCDGPRPRGCDMTFLQPRSPTSLLRLPPPDETSASEGEARAAWDGDEASAWRAPAGRSWLAATWRRPVRVARVELDADGRRRSWPQVVSWEGILADGTRRRLAAFALRPFRLRRQRPTAPHGNIFVFTPPVRVRELRLVRSEGSGWGVAELRVFDTFP